jgi:hypothetical protein
MFYFTLQVSSMVCLQNHAYTPNQWQPCLFFSPKHKTHKMNRQKKGGNFVGNEDRQLGEVFFHIF